MRFRRLKLAGFKSFVEPAELVIDPGLTGVVGPNGCGKSNLLEALRWVMGESSAKALRGGGMEDVIFAGTAARPPRDFAEVVLGAEDDAGDALEVVRRIERGAGSAWRLNGRDVRAKDVGLLFADAATGSSSPALVSQGRIAAVIAARPTERRAMLEDAAGIAGLHARRRDAETRLRATEANLLRLDELAATIEARTGTLRRQARTAERYRALSTRIRSAEARLVFARWRDADGEAQAARAEAQTAGTRVDEAETALHATQAVQAEAAWALATARDTLAERREAAALAGQQIAAITARVEAATARVTELDRQIRRIETDGADADRLTREAADALARLDGALAEAKAARVAEDARAQPLAAAVAAADADLRARETALAEATATQAAIDAEWRVAEAALAAARASHNAAQAEVQRIARTAAALSAEADPAAALAAAIEAAARAATARAAAETARDTATAAREQAAAAEAQAGTALATARADHAAIARQHEALARDKAAREKAARGRAQPVTAGATVAPGWERALSAALGRDASAPAGDASGEGRFWTGAAALEPLPDALLHHVSACPPALAARLARVRCAEADDEQALAPGEWLVTRAGRLRRWDGFVATSLEAAGGAEEALRLEAENRLAALSAELPARTAALAAAEQAHAEARRAAETARTALTEAERAITAAAAEERTALRARDAAEAARDARTRRAAEIAATQDAAAARAAAAEDAFQQAEATRAALPDAAEGRAALAAARTAHEAARSAHQHALAARAAHEQALGQTRERAAALAADIRGWQARAGDAARRLADMDKHLAELAEERAAIADRPAALAGERDAAEAQATALALERATAEAALAQATTTAATADRALAAAQETLASAREARAGAGARAEAADLRRVEMSRISGERFQCPPPLLPGRFEFAPEDVRATVGESSTLDQLTTERERLGPVNLVAADELAQAEDEAARSATERAELAEAVNRLRGSIGNLNREGRERLRAAFVAVDAHFQRLFTTLFEGGQAHLALVDSDDPLEAGLEIYAQPPGKRLQSLTLLSGGEQALTAVALVFALFLTNPAPVCVLDEVDAPLDDANVDRFCDLLDAMVRETETRFLIVTHNAVTMSRMHRLFGVTMVERGVSRLVSVDLVGAEALLAEG